MFAIYETIQVIDHKRTGEQSRRSREYAGITLRTLAKRMKISPAYLSDLERGKRNWSEELCGKYAKTLLGITRVKT
jgi:transcriptional regulator with XRE-family HTH domain